MRVQRSKPGYCAETDLGDDSWVTLAQAGTFRVVASDEYSVTMQTDSLDPKTGDPVSFRVTMTRNQLAHLLRSTQK
jgi:hypothetical protein